MRFGGDVQIKTLNLDIAFKRLKNFVTVEVKPAQNLLLAYVKVDPDSIKLDDGFTRDVRTIGHWGTGDLAIYIKNPAGLNRALPLLQASYEVS